MDDGISWTFEADSDIERRLGVSDQVIPEDFFVDAFEELFEGRPMDIFTDAQMRVQGNVYDFHYWCTRHLQGLDSIGAYPLRGGQEAKWICSDIDTEHGGMSTLEQARRLAQGWAHYGVTAWIEVSRSKGHHVWVFAEDWVSGMVARRAALFVHEMVGVPATEVNPKQEFTPPEVIGNCVRLPYSFQWRHRKRNVMIDEDDEMIGVEQFLETALASKCDTHTLLRLASSYRPPDDRVRPGQDDREDMTPDSFPEYLHIREVFRGRVDVGKGERDNVSWTLANYIFNHPDKYDINEAIDIAKEIYDDQYEEPRTYPFKNLEAKIIRVYSGES